MVLGRKEGRKEGKQKKKRKFAQLCQNRRFQISQSVDANSYCVFDTYKEKLQFSFFSATRNCAQHFFFLLKQRKKPPSTTTNSIT